MNNLFLHIEYLSQYHDCIVVPGFGAFICRNFPAMFNLEEGIVTPPLKSFSFNRSVVLDDGILTNSYMRKYGISAEDAKMAVERASSQLRHTLKTIGKVICGNIGCISQDSEENMIFTPATDSLESVFKPAAIQPISKHIGDNEKTVDIEPDDSSYYHIRINKKFTHYAASLIFILAVALTVFFNPIPTSNLEQRASVLPVGSILKNTDNSEPTVSNCPDSVAPTMESQSEIITEERIEPISTADKQIEKTARHYLIVGTFSSENEALKYASTIKQPGYDFETVPSKKVYRVSMASSDSISELRTVLNSKECREKFPKAWIWSRPI